MEQTLTAEGPVYHLERGTFDLPVIRRGRVIMPVARLTAEELSALDTELEATRKGFLDEVDRLAFYLAQQRAACAELGV